MSLPRPHKPPWASEAPLRSLKRGDHRGGKCVGRGFASEILGGGTACDRLSDAEIEQPRGLATGLDPGPLVEPFSNSAVERIKAEGLAIPFPAMSGAVPCTACAMACSLPAFNDGAMPTPPGIPEAWSDRMSPKRLVVATSR